MSIKLLRTLSVIYFFDAWSFYICKTFLGVKRNDLKYGWSEISWAGPAGETLLCIFSGLHTAEVNPEARKSFSHVLQGSSY